MRSLPRRSLPRLLVAAVCVASTAAFASAARADTGSVGSNAEPTYASIKRVIGHSAHHRNIMAYYRGYLGASKVLVVIGQVHGDETAGITTARYIRDHVKPPAGTGVWIIPTANPDGLAAGTRTNAHHVDLNRNWGTSGWSSAGKGLKTWGGPRPESEPEVRVLKAFLTKVQPRYVVSIHQPLYAVGKSSRAVAFQHRLARGLHLPVRDLSVTVRAPVATSKRVTVAEVTPPTPTPAVIPPTMTGWFNSTTDSNHVAITVEYGHHPSAGYTTWYAARGILSAAGIR